MALQDIPQTLIDFLNAYDTYFVIGHIEPDADCICSQLALASLLRRRGKEALLFSAGPFVRKEIGIYEKLFAKRIGARRKEASAGVVICDCASLERIGELAQDIKDRDVAVIDHHSSREADFGKIRYIQDKAPCVTLLVQKIIEAFGG